MKLIEIFPQAAFQSARMVYKYSDYRLPLHAYTTRKSAMVIKRLISINPSALQERNYDSCYPIHYVVHYYHKDEGMIETLRLIIDSDPLALQRQTSCGKSPLNIPSESHWGVDMVECILSSSTATKSISNQRDMCGMTPLHYACYHRGDEIVEKLLQHPSIDVNATDDLDDTPLHKLFYQDK
jgi:Ankyrin repeats (many copies)